MKILRATRFAPDLSSVSIIMREPDAVMPLEEIGGEEFGFLITDIFEMDGEPSTEIATHMAEDRRLWRAEDERNMALLYYWTFAQFPLLTKGGMVASTEPAPLSEEQIRYVWNQLATLDEYRDFYFTTLTFEGVRIHHQPTGV